MGNSDVAGALKAVRNADGVDALVQQLLCLFEEGTSEH